MAVAFLVIGLLLGLGGLVASWYFTVKSIRGNSERFTLQELLYIGGSIVALGFGCGFLSAATNTWGDWNMDGGHASMAIIGIALFAMCFDVLWLSFAVFYYKKGLEEKQRRIARILMFCAIPLSLIFFLLFGEGVAPYLSYPLINGIYIGGEAGISWSYPTVRGSGSLHIMWYAICILTGVAICYFLCDHKLYQRYGKHGLLEGVVVVGFLCGIIGARIWYVVGNWTVDGFDRDFMKVFAIWDGGLTIIGGAVFGIIGGVSYVAFNKKLKIIDIPWAMGIIIPTILLAQGAGRWGNFFNCEVHGNAVNLVDGWLWLPTWIANNMQYSSTAPSLEGTGQIYVPLFLIESLLNIAGYFLIAYGVDKSIGRWMAPGDLSGCYFIYYGIVRIIMEPMRYGSYNMGEDGNFSVWGSLSYIFIGVGMIVFFELFYHLYTKKRPPKAEVASSEEEIDAL